MNIYICLFVEEEKNAYSQTFPWTIWSLQFSPILRRMGHTVLSSCSDAGIKESWGIFAQGGWTRYDQEQLTEKILADVRLKNKDNGIDLFFCYLFPFQFTPGLFKELTKLGIPSVYFFCDNFSYQEVAKKYGPYATLNWVTELEAIKQFKASGSKAIYLPMAANPEIYYPLTINERMDISFVGSKNPYRRDILGKTLMSGLSLKIFGNGWCPEETGKCTLKKNDQKIRHSANFIDTFITYLNARRDGFSKLLKYGLAPRKRFKQYVALGQEYENILKGVLDANCIDINELNKIYSLSSVSLGFNDQFNSYDGLYFHTNLRNFEAAMAGACYLAQATPELHQLFSDGKEIMIFHTLDELIDKAKFLLKNEAFRRQLRIACRRRALAEHTWGNRFSALFSALGIR